MEKVEDFERAMMLAIDAGRIKQGITATARDLDMHKIYLAAFQDGVEFTQKFLKEMMLKSVPPTTGINIDELDLPR